VRTPKNTPFDTANAYSGCALNLLKGCVFRLNGVSNYFETT
jgi:hypothetical protein